MQSKHINYLIKHINPITKNISKHNLFTALLVLY